MSDEHGQAANELTIWGRLNSYNVQKVVWAAEELGVRYRRVDAGRGYGVVDTADYLAMNPNGRIPLICDGDFVLWESNVIVRYLCARYGLGRLYPVDLRIRMEAEKWMDWEASGIHRAFLPAYKVLVRRDSGFSLEEAEFSMEITAKNLSILNDNLKHNLYVSGENFSIGDIPIGLLVDYFIRIDRDVAGLSHVKRWHTALMNRPAMRNTMRAEWLL